MDAIWELYGFSGNLSYFGLDAIPVGTDGGLLMDVVFLIFIITLAIGPPDIFVHYGIILENLPRPKRRGRGNFLRDLELKTQYNRLYLSMIPLLFTTSELYMNGPLTFLVVSFMIACVVFLFTLAVLIIKCYVCKPGSRFADAFTEKELKIINNADINDIIDLYSKYCRYGKTFFLLDRSKILIYRSVTIIVSILAKHSTGRRYLFNTRALEMALFFVSADMEIKCPKIHEHFILRFTSYIKGNPKFVMGNSASRDLCYCCFSNPANVVIRKTCIGEATCSSCACRPTWCAACFARIFAAAQPAAQLVQWMDGTASCPTCRASFCANDVLFVIDEVDL